MQKSFYSAIPFLGFYLILAKIQTDLITRLVFAALCFTAKDWIELRCLSLGSWLSRLWHIHIIKYCTAGEDNRNIYILIQKYL